MKCQLCGGRAVTNPCGSCAGLLARVQVRAMPEVTRLIVAKAARDTAPLRSAAAVVESSRPELEIRIVVSVSTDWGRY